MLSTIAVWTFCVIGILAVVLILFLVYVNVWDKFWETRRKKQQYLQVKQVRLHLQVLHDRICVDFPPIVVICDYIIDFIDNGNMVTDAASSDELRRKILASMGLYRP